MTKTTNLLSMLAFGLLSLQGCTSSTSSSSANASSANNSTDTATATATASIGQTAALDDKHKNARTAYANYCSGCHGEKLEAFTDRQWKHGNTDEALFQAIKVGYPNEGMPAFDEAFTDEEIKGLVSYIQEGIQNVQAYTFNKEEAMPAVHTSEKMSFKLDTVVTGLESPWGMAFLPNGDMLITDRNGSFYRHTKGKALQKIEGAPQVLVQGQGGLLDVALHPDFAKNNLVYLSYSAQKEEGGNILSTTAVMRAKLEGNKLTNQKVIFEAQPWSRTRHHYGSRLVFGKDNYLYLSVGDRGNHHENAQNLERFPGKVHRIKDDGSIPSDNPYVNQQGAVGSIYTYGNRNIQGMTMHPKTGQIWSNEHGPKGGDEINIIEKGKNYGWPVISYGINYNGTVLTELTKKEGMEQPLHYWVPSIGPSGMAFVYGDRYKAWEGDLLVGSLRFQFLSRLKMDGNKVVSEEKLLKNIGRVRDVRMAPDGHIYISVETPGIIYRLVPTK
ncbi:PQQ-dependent sugar dehydrogenase [Pontibacter ruber]|uniref:PQQ-dependent sugar dehydrogenase n=1 Tax=Pontibacter ruber TaxID=1343895 RepID=A0ABW5CXF1_9BACT|nr:PQQ-dependent sugar dehydrogenase [Pontibacter ruber]